MNKGVYKRMITVNLRYDAFTGRSIYDLIKDIVPKAFVSADLSEPFDPYRQHNIQMATFEEWEDLIIALDEEKCDYEIVTFSEEHPSIEDTMRELMKAISIDAYERDKMITEFATISEHDFSSGSASHAEGTCTAVSGRYDDKAYITDLDDIKATWGDIAKSYSKIGSKPWMESSTTTTATKADSWIF